MKTSIKLQLVKVKIRNPQGIKRMSPWLRHKAYPYTFHSQKSIEVPITDINTKNKFITWVWNNGGEGMWQVRAPCPNKHAQKGISMKAIADLTLEQHPTNEWKYNIIKFEGRRLMRYKKILGWSE